MMRKLTAATAVAVALAGCASNPVSVMRGPPVSTVETPYSAALACLSGAVPAASKKFSIGVGAVTDKTGKFSLDDGGYKVSQGPELMVISALSKTNAVQLVERIDTRPLEWELKFANDKVLGDGEMRTISTPTGQQQVAYRGIQPGILAGSDYYLVGGITSIDYDIFSAGAEVNIAGYGGGAREYRLLVGVDLRLVDSRTGRVAGVASLEKQVVGVETKLNLFRFFGSRLYDLSAGTKKDEPMQLAVRAVIENAVFDLVANLYGGADATCRTLEQHAMQETAPPAPATTTVARAP
jgi:curli biogenesis system outer membrane secretion channel CsgG